MVYYHADQVHACMNDIR